MVTEIVPSTRTAGPRDALDRIRQSMTVTTATLWTKMGCIATTDGVTATKASPAPKQTLVLARKCRLPPNGQKNGGARSQWDDSRMTTLTESAMIVSAYETKSGTDRQKAIPECRLKTKTIDLGEFS